MGELIAVKKVRHQKNKSKMVYQFRPLDFYFYSWELQLHDRIHVAEASLSRIVFGTWAEVSGFLRSSTRGKRQLKSVYKNRFIFLGFHSHEFRFTSFWDWRIQTLILLHSIFEVDLKMLGFLRFLLLTLSEAKKSSNFKDSSQLSSFELQVQKLGVAKQILHCCKSRALSWVQRWRFNICWWLNCSCAFCAAWLKSTSRRRSRFLWLLFKMASLALSRFIQWDKFSQPLMATSTAWCWLIHIVDLYLSWNSTLRGSKVDSGFQRVRPRFQEFEWSVRLLSRCGAKWTRTLGLTPYDVINVAQTFSKEFKGSQISQFALSFFLSLLLQRFMKRSIRAKIDQGILEYLDILGEVE